MSLTTTSGQLILSALTEYANQTGIDLTKIPFVDNFQSCHSESVEVIFELLQDRAKAFKEFRDGNRKLINCLRPIVLILHTFSGILEKALTLVSP
jgi:fungal STAND N-terminal Goodbye domain